jgi:hypothetical protein
MPFPTEKKSQKGTVHSNMIENGKILNLHVHERKHIIRKTGK